MELELNFEDVSLRWADEWREIGLELMACVADTNTLDENDFGGAVEVSRQANALREKRMSMICDVLVSLPADMMVRGAPAVAEWTPEALKETVRANQLTALVQAVDAGLLADPND